jgi:hypothetical protein
MLSSNFHRPSLHGLRVAQLFGRRLLVFLDDPIRQIGKIWGASERAHIVVGHERSMRGAVACEALETGSSTSFAAMPIPGDTTLASRKTVSSGITTALQATRFTIVDALKTDQSQQDKC